MVCSEASLVRPGVLNEIQETLAREARDGGASYLLPIALDDYVYTDFKTVQLDVAQRVLDRVVGDFRGTERDPEKFSIQVARVIDALRRTS